MSVTADRTGRAVLILAGVIGCASIAHAGGVVHVDDDATPGGDGLSWVSAFDDLQDALAAAVAGDEIWVAAGTYFPDQGSDRLQAFELVDGVSIYGGFDGTETAFEQRDWFANLTILSGDLDEDDAAGFVNYDENSFTILRGNALFLDLSIDGFVVTAANANNGSFIFHTGGGIRIDSDEDGVVTIANCTFTLNSAWNGGAGYLRDTELVITDCTIEDNRATMDHCGGLFVHGSGLSITACAFTDNTTTQRAGGLYLSSFTSDVTVTDCVFEGNDSEFFGGGLYCDSPFFTNLTCTVRGCTFRDNTVASMGSQGTGGGLAADTAHIDVLDSLFVNNESGLHGGGLYLMRDNPGEVINCRFHGNASLAGQGGGLYIGTGGATSSRTACSPATRRSTMAAVSPHPSRAEAWASSSSTARSLTTRATTTAVGWWRSTATTSSPTACSGRTRTSSARARTRRDTATSRSTIRACRDGTGRSAGPGTSGWIR